MIPFTALRKKADGFWLEMRQGGREGETVVDSLPVKTDKIYLSLYCQLAGNSLRCGGTFASQNNNQLHLKPQLRELPAN